MIAGKYCDTLDLGGYRDWRVPTANEMLYIIDWGISQILLLEKCISLYSHR